MIFITVGSQKFQFNRLLEAIDQLVQKNVITETVIAQSGASSYKPINYEYKPFFNRDEFKRLMKQSDIVITHGGTGAIISALKQNKKVIVVPRLKKFGEHVDDHQLQLIKEFEDNNFIISCLDVSELDQAIQMVNKKKFSRYQSQTDRYLIDLCKYIDKL
ncbi:glycosyltransferase 28-like protein [Lachnospiraceae bacterium TWA4]|nr:glycosyltransferase 28-like protein [Lachnospiraceae bacterium TWA4]